MTRENQGSSYYEGEQQPSKIFLQYCQDADIHPNQLSGDEQGQKSIFASSANDAKANFFLTVMTIVKTVIGSGILAIPFTMAKMGYVFGTVIFLLAGVVCQNGSVLLLKAKNLSRHSNLSTIFYEVWKTKIAKGIGSIVIFLNNIGVCIAELIIFKQSIRKILEDVLGQGHDVLDQFYTQTYFLVIIMAIAQTPPTLVSKMQKLKFMALAGVTGICIFIITFVVFFIFAVADQNPDNNPKGNMEMFPINWFKAFAAVPNLMLALSYQVNLFPIYKGMKNVSDKKYALASLAGISFCVFCYLLVGLLGYYYSGPQIKANFLTSLEYGKVAQFFYFTINFFFLISIFFAFPIMFFGCRNNFIALIKLVLIKNEDQRHRNVRGDDVEEISSYMDTAMKLQDRRKKARLYFILYTIGIYLVIIGVAMGVQSIESVFNIIGAICSTSVSILLPCFFYCKLIQMRKQPKNVKYYISIALVCIMTPYAIFSMVALYVDV